MPITIARPYPTNSIIFSFYYSAEKVGLKISTTFPIRIAYVGITIPAANEKNKPHNTTNLSLGVEY